MGYLRYRVQVIHDLEMCVLKWIELRSTCLFHFLFEFWGDDPSPFKDTRMITRRASCLTPKSLCPLRTLRVAVLAWKDCSVPVEPKFGIALDKYSWSCERAGQVLSRRAPESSFAMPVFSARLELLKEPLAGMPGTLGAFPTACPAPVTCSRVCPFENSCPGIQV